MGYEAIMINCNPETVSADFDFADKLYFEPVYWERVLDIIEHEQPDGYNPSCTNGAKVGQATCKQAYIFLVQNFNA